MRSLFGFLLGISLVFVAGASNCQYGEGIVCRDYATAKSCGMLKTCEDLWLHASILDRGSSTGDCSHCKHLLENKMYTQLTIMLSNQKEIGHVELNEIFKLQANLKNASLVCALFKQCPGSVFTLPTLRFNATSICADCEKIIDDVRVLLEDQATKTAVATYLKAAFCIHIPLQLVDICKKSVDRYTGAIIDLVSSKLESNRTCALFGLCPMSVFRPASPKVATKVLDPEVYSWIRRPSGKGHAMWHSRLTKKDNSSICTDCQNVFSRIRSEVKNPEFDKLLKNVIVSKICSSFGIFTTMCEAAVSKQVDEMITEASTTNLTDLCIFFNQCRGTLSPTSKTFIDNLEKNNFTSQPKGNVEIPGLCELCEVAIKAILDATINNRTEEAVMAALEAACDWFSEPRRSNCKRYIDKYGEAIVKAILSGAAPRIICASFGVCYPFQSYVPQLSVKAVLVVETVGTPCLMCQAMTSLVSEKLRQNSTIIEIEKDLEIFCSHAHHHRTKCTKLVKKYTPIVVELFISGVPESEVCKIVKFCKSAADDDDATDKPKKEGCVTCELIIEHIYSSLEPNSTLEEIQKALKTVCDTSPYFVDECQHYTKQYTAKLAQSLKTGIPENKVCQELDRCTQEKKEAKPTTLILGCEICEMVIDFIYTKIESNDTIEMIEQKLETVCHYIPYYQDTCREYVKAYTADLIKLLVDGIPSKQICEMLGLCAQKNNEVKPMPSDQACTMCEMIIDYFYTKIGSNDTVDEIEKTLETVCQYIPYYADTCREYVKAYTADLIKLLIDGVPSKVVCQELGICPPDFHSVQKAEDQVCDICVQIIVYIYSQIEDDSTIDEIEQALETVCDYIPYYKSECHTYVKKYTKQLVYMLVDKLPPKQVCQKLGFCESAKHIEILCRSGPSAWCRDTRSAALCSKTSFCQQFFWSTSVIPKRRSSNSVELFDCNKLTNLAERCKQERAAKMCGLSTKACAPLRAFGKSRQDPSCSFCRRVLGIRMLSGAHSVDCSIFITSREKEDCEKLKKLVIPYTLSWDKMDAICKENSMCGNQTEKKKETNTWILGDNPCLWGTSVVCQTMDNAERCGQVDFCRRRVWNGETPPLRPEQLKPTTGIKLVDCELPLDKLCISPALRFCGSEVRKRCKNYTDLIKREYVPNKADLSLKESVCRSPRFTLCNDKDIIELCGLERYCEAMGLAPPTEKAAAPRECSRGPAYVCQSYANAKRCNSLDLCITKYWA